MPISIYSIVQTGAKIQLGGLNKGLLAAAYQPLTPDDVNSPDIVPTRSGIKIEIKSFISFKAKYLYKYTLIV
jgi:hypothetical protein